MFRPRLLLCFTLLAGVLALTSCRNRPSPIKNEEGKTYKTQIGMYVEHGRHETTNYGRGWHLPVNSTVKILDTTARSITVQVPDQNKKFQIINRERHSKKNIKEIFNLYFGKKKVDLSSFPEDVQKHIKNGELKKGMSKKAALLARGYPPAHRTPSTKNDEWIYWDSRWTNFRVHFSDDKISSIQR